MLSLQIGEKTANGMATLGSSLNKNVDLFFQIGASRGKNIIPQFEAAFQEDRLTALRILFWSRDVRGGAGERQLFRDVLKYLETQHPTELQQAVGLVAEYGRFDDLLCFQTQYGKDLAFKQIKDALDQKNGLCAKWMPRKGPVAAELRSYLKLSPKQYRKLLVSLTKVVETLMCANQWDKIEYSHVPSVASARYQNAFKTHDPTGYQAFKTKLTTGEATINASALYPYDVVRSLDKGDTAVAQAQWDALPNFMGDKSILPMVDVSGSMDTPVGGNKTSSLTCLDVAVSLGLYLSDKCTGPFKDMFMSFSGSPVLQVLTGSLSDRLAEMNRSDWEMNTNLTAAFEVMLQVAVRNNVPQNMMPEYLLILSDMEFDQCVNKGHDQDTAMEMIDRKFEEAGYTRPTVVFWNLNGRNKNVPIKFDTEKTALISGFSPSIMKSVLSADILTPEGVMLATINSPRYNTIQ
jgi:hypothetical protein